MLEARSWGVLVLGVGLGACAESPIEVDDTSSSEAVGTAVASGDDASASPLCGNGEVDAEEECDDADDDALDGCMPDCRLGPTGLIFGATFITPQSGNTMMGAPFNDTCPQGQVLVGLEGRIEQMQGPQLRGLQGICGEPTLVYGGGAFGVEVGEGKMLPAHGREVGDRVRSECEAHEVVVGFEGRADQWAVEQLQLHCAPILVVDDGTAIGAELGSLSRTSPLGGNDGMAFDDVSCGAGAVARGSNMQADQDRIRAFGLGCGTLTLRLGP